MKITVEVLKYLDACEPQVELFQRIFPVGAEITPENIERGQIWQLSTGWLAYRVMSRELYDEYVTALQTNDQSYVQACQDSEVEFYNERMTRQEMITAKNLAWREQEDRKYKIIAEHLNKAFEALADIEIIRRLLK